MSKQNNWKITKTTRLKFEVNNIYVCGIYLKKIKYLQPLIHSSNNYSYLYVTLG